MVREQNSVYPCSFWDVHDIDHLLVLQIVRVEFFVGRPVNPMSIKFWVGWLGEWSRKHLPLPGGQVIEYVVSTRAKARGLFPYRPFTGHARHTTIAIRGQRRAFPRCPIP